jgi:hypothetical protein
VDLPTVADLDAAREEYERREPRDLFYRVALDLMSAAQRGEGQFTQAEALAILLQPWNGGYYRFQKVPFEAAHFDAIEDLLVRHAGALAAARARSIASLRETDRLRVQALFTDFAGVLGRVGAAKALHLTARRFFPLWDNRIANRAYHLYALDARDYWRLMVAVCNQVRASGGEDALGRNAVRAIDQYNYCRYTLGWMAAPNPAVLSTRLRSGTKSARMRHLFAQGHTVAEVAKALDVAYAFAYGVHQRWLQTGG